MSEVPCMTSGATLDGTTRESLYAFGYDMLQADNLEVAIKAFRVFVRFAPTDERAWLGLAACHEKLDQPDVAAELYGAGAVVALPESGRCHLGVARLTDDRVLMAEHLERARDVAEEAGDDALLALVRGLEIGS